MPAYETTQLDDRYAAIKIQFTWFGVSKSLTKSQKSTAAAAFHASGDYLSGGKKKINTKNEHYTPLTAWRSQIKAYIKGNSLPYPEDGVRLIRRDRCEEIAARLNTFEQEGILLAYNLQQHFDELKAEARANLGYLFDSSEYPSDVAQQFSVDWDFIEVNPPDYLQELNPALYEQQAEKARARFQQAVDMAEDAFIQEFSKVVDHLCDRLTPDTDGKAKGFQKATLENVSKLFEGFGTLTSGDNEALEQLLSKANALVAGVDPKELKSHDDMKENLKEKMESIKTTLDAMVVTRASRKLMIEDDPESGGPVKIEPTPPEVVQQQAAEADGLVVNIEGQEYEVDPQAIEQSKKLHEQFPNPTQDPEGFKQGLQQLADATGVSVDDFYG